MDRQVGYDPGAGKEQLAMGRATRQVVFALVMVDDERDYASLKPSPVVRLDGGPGALADWSAAWTLGPTRHTLRAIDLGSPGVVFEATGRVERKHGLGDLEVFDVEGEGRDAEDVAFYAQLRAEEQQTGTRKLMGRFEDRLVHAGTTFDVVDPLHATLNGRYLITSAYLSASPGAAAEPARLATRIEAVSLATPYRPARRTPWPLISSPLVAEVADAGDGRAVLDARGRVKVRFFWSRDAPAAEDSWLRITQPMGTIPARPQVAGEQLLIEFLEGAPNSPIVVGRVAP